MTWARTRQPAALELRATRLLCEACGVHAAVLQGVRLIGTSDEGGSVYVASAVPGRLCTICHANRAHALQP